MTMIMLSLRSAKDVERKGWRWVAGGPSLCDDDDNDDDDSVVSQERE